ncbi:hypothetical protein GCM10009007_17230 [Formosimonas limnophila]|uniref:Uncharacterized protein n=1 Tax=Formosimonas limnophila TaxID=1384487 RepID=A0A8J3G095_9BURK|nr:hypothetical protein GCM10009007_17230 [Formosimonas limnophila]
MKNAFFLTFHFVCWLLILPLSWANMDNFPKIDSSIAGVILCLMIGLLIFWILFVYRKYVLNSTNRENRALNTFLFFVFLALVIFASIFITAIVSIIKYGL